MNQTLTKKNVTKSEAKMALVILADFNKQTIEPFYEAKRNALPQKPSFDRMDKRYQSRSFQARMAITTLTSEIGAIDD